MNPSHLRGTAVNRNILGALCALLILVSVPLAVYASGPGREHEVIAPAVSSVSVSPVADTDCAEDDPCFNPCTMGVDGRYADTDPRYLVPGPCDLSTVLPYGARFGLSVSPVESDGVTCPATWVYVVVWVHVVTTDGAVRGSVSASGCAPVSDPLSAGVGAPEIRETLCRDAARRYA